MTIDVSVELSTPKIDGLLALYSALPGKPGFQKVMGAIGQRLASRVQLGFRTSTDPWGHPWQALKYREGQPLVDTGVLKHSITYFADSDQVAVGTKMEYAPGHQFGMEGQGMPSRPFFPLDREGEADLPNNWEKSILNAIKQHLQKAIQ